MNQTELDWQWQLVGALILAEQMLFSGVFMNKNVCGAIHSFCTVCALRASIRIQSHKGLFSGSVLSSLLMVAADIQFAAPGSYLAFTGCISSLSHPSLRPLM